MVAGGLGRWQAVCRSSEHDDTATSAAIPPDVTERCTITSPRLAVSPGARYLASATTSLKTITRRAAEV